MNRRTIFSMATIAALGLVMLPPAPSASKDPQGATRRHLDTGVDHRNRQGRRQIRAPGPQPERSPHLRSQWPVLLADLAIRPPEIRDRQREPGHRGGIQGRGDRDDRHIGTWAVDEATKTITTYIEAGSFPNLNGNTQKRVISALTADELKYVNGASAVGTSRRSGVAAGEIAAPSSERSNPRRPSTCAKAGVIVSAKLALTREAQKEAIGAEFEHRRRFHVPARWRSSP